MVRNRVLLLQRFADRFEENLERRVELIKRRTEIGQRDGSLRYEEDIP